MNTNWKFKICICIDVSSIGSTYYLWHIGACLSSTIEELICIKSVQLYDETYRTLARARIRMEAITKVLELTGTVTQLVYLVPASSKISYKYV